MKDEHKEKSEDLAMEFIIRAIKELHGYNFENYSAESLKRRIMLYLGKHEMALLSDLVGPLLQDKTIFKELLKHLSVTVTEMFRDPEFYKSFIKNVLPTLKTYSYVKIWHAGCATGQEPYSMAILLSENKFLSRTQIYATDFNPYALSCAKKGIYSSESIDKYSRSYIESGGKHNLVDYYTRQYNSCKISKQIRERILFSQHNLSTDDVFSEVEVIICRNVMIYFNEDLKEKVTNIFVNSLSDYGFLCLGSAERASSPRLKCIDKKNAIYQKQPVRHYE